MIGYRDNKSIYSFRYFFRIYANNKTFNALKCRLRYMSVHIYWDAQLDRTAVSDIEETPDRIPHESFQECDFCSGICWEPVSSDKPLQMYRCTNCGKGKTGVE